MLIKRVAFLKYVAMDLCKQNGFLVNLPIRVNYLAGNLNLELTYHSLPGIMNLMFYIRFHLIDL